MWNTIKHQYRYVLLFMSTKVCISHIIIMLSIFSVSDYNTKERYYSWIFAKNFFFCLFLIFSNLSKWKGLNLSSLGGLSLVMPLLVLRELLDMASLSSCVINTSWASGEGDLCTSRSNIIFSRFFSCILFCSSSSFLLGGLKVFKNQTDIFLFWTWLPIKLYPNLFETGVWNVVNHWLYV